MAVTSSRVDQAHRWLYLPDGWDSGWKAAKSASASTPAQVAVIGDSNAQGFTTTDHMTKAFPFLLRDQLIAKYGRYADYWPITHSARFQTVMGGIAPAGTQPWTFDTAWGTQGGIQFNGYGYTIFNDTGNPTAWVNAGSGKFDAPYACTAFDIITHDFTNASTWKYSIDNAAGGGLVTITNDARNTVRRTAVTGQTNAVHAIRFGAASTTFALGLNGVVTYVPGATGGIAFANVSGTGMRVMDWATSPNGMPDDRTRQWQGRYKVNAASAVSETGFGFPTQPHLAIIELGINDCANSNGIIQFRQGLRRLVDAVRRGRDNASVIFVICPNPTLATTDTTSQFLRAESWSIYAEQLYGIALEYQCALFNVHADWMSTPVAQGFLTAGDPHPNDAGHQAIADVLATVIV